MGELQIGNIESMSYIYGPGQRFVIWIQGCSLACKGCWNQQFWSTSGGSLFQVSELLEMIQSIPNTEGITLLGGEPLQQPDAVLELIRGVKAIGLSVFLYTGYTRKEFDETMAECASMSDILVCGRYIESQRNDSLRWRGSENQKIEFPTTRYQGLQLDEVR